MTLTSARIASPVACCVAAFVLSILATGPLGTASASDAPIGPPAPLAVVVDIRPGVCPNHLRPSSPLTLPVAILGTTDLDVTNIDPESVRLSRAGAGGQCGPSRWAYADVGDLVIGSSPECNEPRGDGFDDLALEFPIPDLVRELGIDEESGDDVPLVLSGVIVTGQGIEGADLVVVLGDRAGAGAGDLSAGVGLLEPTALDADGSSGGIKLTYYTNASDRITLAIYDARGQMVARLVDADRAPGIYSVTWDATTREGRGLPRGTYFARVTNGIAGDTIRLALP